MKKVLFMMISLLAISFYSCSNDNVMENNDGTELTGSTMRQVEENLKCMKLQSSVHDYNIQMFGEELTPQTRGWKDFFKKFKKIFVTVAADAVGGAIGGIAVGVVSSAAVGALVYSGAVDAEITPMKVSGLGGDSIPIFNGDGLGFGNLVPEGGYLVAEGLDSLGFYHNKVLKRIFTQRINVKDFVVKSDEEKAEIVISEMVKEPYIVEYYGNDINDLVKASEGIRLSDVIMNAAEASETEEEFFDKLTASGCVDDNVMMVLREILSGLAKIDPEADDGTYYQTVLDIVNKSDVSEDVKRNVQAGTIIGQASNRLWFRQTDLDFNIDRDGLIVP